MKIQPQRPIYLSTVFLAVATIMETLTTTPAQAIYIRHDIPDSEYVVKGHEYPALVDLLDKGDCIGTLFNSSHLITVAHCANDLKEGRTLMINGVSHAIAKPILHPKWNIDDDEHDIALVPLKKPVKGVVPLPLYQGNNELNAIVTIIGRGDTATGLDGEKKAKSDGKLRRGTNKISDVDNHFLEVTFERAGQKDVTPLEAVGGGGDSGGPLFIDVDGTSYIAGLNAWGEDEGGLEIGKYGGKDYSIRVSKHIPWIEKTLAPK